ncbi:MAG: right-handed parallel beta-helix repeat-containing protein, partial [Thermoplasmata archaeon]|nr:right-handed parallel beta-helix repeat-containing protein [Thermoplasmata archaeon]
MLWATPLEGSSRAETLITLSFLPLLMCSSRPFHLLVILLLLLALIPFVPQQEAHGQWLYVGGGGDGNYSTIQDAVDAASMHDVIFVYDGVYEEALAINKSISLIGESMGGVVVGVQRPDYIPNYIIDINVSNVYITNISTVHGKFAGVYVHAAFACEFQGVSATSSNYGFKGYLAERLTLENCNFSGNSVTGAQFNICSIVTLIDSSLTDNFRGGVLMEQCDNFTIQGNEMADGGDAALFISGGGGHVVENNTLSYVMGAGMVIDNSHNNSIGWNQAHNNTLGGVEMIYSNNTSLYNNTFERNGMAGLLLYDECTGASVRGNDISHNGFGLNITRSGGH